MSALGANRTRRDGGNDVNDAVDGACSAASKCHRMVASKPERFKEVRPGNDDGVPKFWRNWRGHDDVMQTRSIRGSGEPVWVIALLKCALTIGTRSAQSIMASGFTAAQTGRTHDRTRPMLQKRQKVLAKAAFAAMHGPDLIYFVCDPALGMPMRRREFIATLGGAAAWPLAARAQQSGGQPSIGFVGSDSPDTYTDRLRAFRLGLKSTGFIEGQNVAIEYRWAEGRNDKLPALTADLVQRQVTVIIAPTTPSVLAAKTATEVIPIVFFVAGDPVDLGLVTSLRRPGGNFTGENTLTLEVEPKWL